MNNQDILETLKLMRENSPKRNFTQSVDLIINLQGLNLKKPEENILTFLPLPHGKGKQNKIAALVGQELIKQAKETCDTVIVKDEFPEYQRDKKRLKKLAKSIDFFIAQANLMTDIAKYFGKVIGPMGKMPNPKAGAVVPPIIPDIKPIIEKIRKTVKLQTKNELTVKCIVGVESMKDEHLTENISSVYNHIIHSVKDEKNNVKNVIIKLSMAQPFIIGKKYTPEELQPKQKIQKKSKDEK